MHNRVTASHAASVAPCPLKQPETAGLALFRIFRIDTGIVGQMRRFGFSDLRLIRRIGVGGIECRTGGRLYRYRRGGARSGRRRGFLELDVLRRQYVGSLVLI